jgi:hypothetical protein
MIDDQQLLDFNIEEITNSFLILCSQETDKIIPEESKSAPAIND